MPSSQKAKVTGNLTTASMQKKGGPLAVDSEARNGRPKMLLTRERTSNLGQHQTKSSESVLEVRRICPSTTAQRTSSITNERVSTEDLLAVMAESFKKLSTVIEENRRVPKIGELRVGQIQQGEGGGDGLWNTMQHL